MKLRVKFSKHGPIKFIGHLDTMRYFQKAVRRAGIDVAYSTGFSPHQIMSFAYPLGVGMTSDGEYMDIEVCTAKSAADIMERLNAVMADGIHVLQVVALPDTVKNAMASVAAASYRITFREGYLPTFSLEEAVDRFNSLPEVMYLKKTDKSEIEIDLKQGVYKIEAVQEDQVDVLLDASSAGNIKPAFVVDALYQLMGASVPAFAFSVHRFETYLRDANGELRPLGYVGTDF